jgi:hypothetical protein
MAGAVLALVGVAGCGSPEPVREEVAALMPQPAAVKIVQEVLPEYDGGAALPWGDSHLMIRALRELHHYSNNRLVEDSFRRGCIGNVSLEDARRFAEALNSMGATIQLIRHQNPALSACPRTKR